MVRSVPLCTHHPNPQFQLTFRGLIRVLRSFESTPLAVVIVSATIIHITEAMKRRERSQLIYEVEAWGGLIIAIEISF
jgi:hypothetical protein